MATNRNSGGTAIALPSLDTSNWAACLLTLEEHAIFQLGWDPSRAAYALERLQEAAAGLRERGEDIGPDKMPADALWCLFDGWGNVWDMVNGCHQSTAEVQDSTAKVLDDVAKLSALRDEMAAGMAWLEDKPERGAYAYRRLGEIGVPDKRCLPLDHPDHFSQGAMFRLAMAYGEVWDNLSGFSH